MQKLNDRMIKFLVRQCSPHAFDMKHWRPCGTAGCIGGWALTLAEEPAARPDARDLEVQRAGELLDLKPGLERHLFYPSSWLNWCHTNSPQKLVGNSVPSMETVEEMRAFARSIFVERNNNADYDLLSLSGRIQPRNAARALYDVSHVHPDYINWERACREPLTKVPEECLA